MQWISVAVALRAHLADTLVCLFWLADVEGRYMYTYEVAVEHLLSAASSADSFATARNLGALRCGIKRRADVDGLTELKRWELAHLKHMTMPAIGCK